jgi:hypothetical protein
MSIRSNTIFILILPISSTRSPRRNPSVKAFIALSSETLTAEFLIMLHLWIYDLSVLLRCYTQALTSFIDAGRLYVDLKLLVNCLVSSSQLLIVPFSNLLNHDLATPVRCSCKLCITVSFVPPNIFLKVYDSREGPYCLVYCFTKSYRVMFYICTEGVLKGERSPKWQNERLSREQQ